MTDDTPRDDPPAEPHDDRREGGLFSSLLRLLEALERRAAADGRNEGRRLDYDVSIRTGLDALEDRRHEREPPGRRPSGARPTSPSSEAAERTADAAHYNLTTHRRGDELLVTADVAGVDPDDVTVGFDGDTLVVAVEGETLERVEIPWRESTADARVNNGVLTVSARSTADE